MVIWALTWNVACTHLHITKLPIIFVGMKSIYRRLSFRLRGYFNLSLLLHIPSLVADLMHRFSKLCRIVTCSTLLGISLKIWPWRLYRNTIQCNKLCAIQFRPFAVNYLNDAASNLYMFRYLLIITCLENQLWILLKIKTVVFDPCILQTTLHFKHTYWIIHVGSGRLLLRQQIVTDIGATLINYILYDMLDYICIT